MGAIIGPDPEAFSKLVDFSYSKEMPICWRAMWLVDYLAEERSIIEAGEFRHKYGHLFALDKTKAAIQEELEITFQTRFTYRSYQTTTKNDVTPDPRP